MEHNTSLPFVSTLLVTRNEKDYIRLSMMSLINQTYPKDKYEIIVIDGNSNDGTLDEIKALQCKYSTDSFKIKLLNNEKLILSAGWNIGIKAAKGNYVLRIDAHSTIALDYVEKCVETISRVDAVGVGGILVTESLSGGDEAVPLVLSSPFGVGNSIFRVSGKEGYADTASYLLYKKEIFEKAGYFDEEMVRNQDIEEHSRIKKAGGRLYFNPKIIATYYSRNTVKKMLKQAYGNGQWNMVLLKKDKSALSIRHLIPFAFVVFLIAAFIFGFLWHPIWLIGLGVICLHLLLGLYFAAKKTNKLKLILKMPILYISLHIAYGLGYIKGLFK